MKDIYKNPILYYIAIPVMVGLWPLLVWVVYLPAAQDSIDSQITEYGRAEQVMIDILTLDPERLESAGPNEVATEFSYTGDVNEVADSCRISEGNYKVRSGIIVETQDQKSQTANVNLSQVNMVKFAEFLSEILSRPNLQCESVKLTKKENLPDNDMWDVDIRFKYYY